MLLAMMLTSSLVYLMANPIHFLNSSFIDLEPGQWYLRTRSNSIQASTPEWGTIAL